MKVLFITNQICGPSGLERVLSIRTDYMIEDLKYEVHIITLNQGELPVFYDFNKNIIFHDLTITGGTISYLSGYVKKLRKAVRVINPAVISVCDDGVKGFFVPLILSRAYPSVYERHASKDIEKRNENPTLLQRIKLWFTFFSMEFGAKYFDKFVLLTEGHFKEWNLKNMMVIPNPLSFYPEANAKLENKKAIVLGSHTYPKGFDRLLLVWAKVLKKHPDWQLEIYGKRDAENTYEKLAKEMNIMNNVTFFEPIKDIVSRYLDASIYVMSSRNEGFGMVLTEAMACGVPCVAFDCPQGPSDIITHEEDGILVADGDLDLMATQINRLIENPALRRMFAKNAKQNVKRYLPKNVTNSWHALFLELAKKNKLKPDNEATFASKQPIKE